MAAESASDAPRRQVRTVATRTAETEILELPKEPIRQLVAVNEAPLIGKRHSARCGCRCGVWICQVAARRLSCQTR